MTTTPRGIRNCNPLNIRRSAAKWKGLCAQQNDASFCQFESMEWGWRAAFWLLTRVYYHTYRLFTIRKIITKWAPPIENHTAGAMAIQENGTAQIDDFAMLKGFDLARQEAK